MSNISILVSFQAKRELRSELHSLLCTVVARLPDIEGCRSAVLFAAIDDDCVFTLLEEWQSSELHQIHLDRVIASGDWDRIVSLVATAPTSRRYRCLGIQS